MPALLLLQADDMLVAHRCQIIENVKLLTLSRLIAGLCIKKHDKENHQM